MLTLQTLKNLFPVSGDNNATTGRIPMSFVEANLKEIAKLVKEEGLRRIYRGPREGHDQTFTLKVNAESLLLYRK